MTITPDVLKAVLEQLFEAPWEQIHSTFTQSAQVASEFQELAPIVRDVWREKEQAQLKQAWGEEFDGVYGYLSEKVFPNLPAHEQALYNNSAGLQVLAQRHRGEIEAHLTASSTPEPSAKAPSPGQVLSPNGGAGKATPPSFKQSDILKLSAEEYESQRTAIEQAFESGAVAMDL
jgi:hypothetical protein